MNIKYLMNLGFLIVSAFILGCSKNKKINCLENNGFWYNNECWYDFKDEGIPKSKIDSTVTAEMEIINQSLITINNTTYPLVAFLPEDDDEKGILFIAVYGTIDNYKTILFPTGKQDIENGIIKAPAILFNGNAISGSLDGKSKLDGMATINVIDFENSEIEIAGEILNNEDNAHIDFRFKANESIMGVGDSHLEIKDNEAYLSGVLGTITYSQIKELIAQYPHIKTIVMTNVLGSVNDAVNMHTGRVLRENGFTTKVLSDSDIASGGVDLFCAGKKRIIEAGAKIGVHSWCCIDDLTASEIPKTHPAHQYQIEYFTMALGEKIGSDFYFFTLEAAPYNDIHYMTDEEIKEWNIGTEFLKTP